MQYDPRQQPNIPPAPIEPTGFFTGIQFRPIIAGVVVDTVATIVLVSAYYALVVAKELPAPGGAAGDDAFAKYWSSSEGLMASLLIGSLGTLIGGFYAAYKAGTLEMKHGAMVGVGSIILGLLLQSGSSEKETPDWFIALSLVAAIPAGALGGFLAELFKNAVGKTGATNVGNWPGRGN
jgi:putative membrane protein (TIGR04086 family)